MKVRKGYVSNSSSSSYIVEFKGENDSVTVAGEVIYVRDLFEQINGFGALDENGMYENTLYDEEAKKELVEKIEYLMRNNADDRAELEKLKEDILSAGPTGPYFARFEIGYHDKLGGAVYSIFKKNHIIVERFFSN